MEVSEDPARSNVVVRDTVGVIRGWASAHDRAAGRMLLVVVVDRRLNDECADEMAAWLFAWAGHSRGGRPRRDPPRRADPPGRG